MGEEFLKCAYILAQDTGCISGKEKVRYIGCLLAEIRAHSNETSNAPKLYSEKWRK